jgi:two-component system OmpR family response regulator
MREPNPRSTMAPVEPGLAPEPGAARRGAILIVEDRDDVRQGLSQLLEFQGYVVFEASDFTEAFSHLESSPQGIALILLDLNLPGPSGETLRAAQLANPQLSDIPTVVVSACSPDIPGSAELRAAAWIEKPFRFEQLLDQVRRFVLPEGSDGLRTSSQVQPPAA